MLIGNARYNCSCIVRYVSSNANQLALILGLSISLAVLLIVVVVVVVVAACRRRRHHKTSTTDRRAARNDYIDRSIELTEEDDRNYSTIPDVHCKAAADRSSMPVPAKPDETDTYYSSIGEPQPAGSSDYYLTLKSDYVA